MRTQKHASLPLTLRKDSPGTLPGQLTEQLRSLVTAGVLQPSDPLPSTRALAAQLGVSRGTIVSAYEQLTAEGWFSAQRGSATIVNPRLADMQLSAPATHRTPPAPRTAPAPRPRLIDLRPGRPMTQGVAGAEWKSAWRRAGDDAVNSSPPRLGLPELRQQIAEQLRLRGVVRDPSRIAITAGAREGLALLLLATRARTIGVEDPGYPSLRRVLKRYGARPVPLATDRHGLVTSELPHTAPDAVVVTPSHQHPLGGSLPADRRHQLLDWARAHDTLIIEDDYDSQLRYTSEPLPALASLDTTDQVILLGTFSKLLTPALGIGYVVLPEHLREPAAQVRDDCGDPVGLTAQRALAHYLATGALTRHTQRMRTLYRKRRALVTRELAGIDGAVLPMDGGLHCVVTHDHDSAQVLAQIEEKGVRVTSLSDYWATDTGRGGLVFGFGDVSDAQLTRGLRAIRVVLSDGDGSQTATA